MRETIPLGSVIYINPNSIGKSFPFKEIEYIDISSVGTGTLTGSTRLSLPDAPSRAKRLVKPGDTILATVRPNLRSFYYVKNPRPNTVVSTGFAVLRAKESIDKRYIYYSVTSQAFTDYLSANVKGAAYPAVDTEIIARGKIYLPSLATQHKIASILSAYDDLIENNLNRIKILEEMAQMIYREWFVNFRFPGHEKVKMVKSELRMIPKGWQVKKMSEVADVIDCLHSKKPKAIEEGTKILLQLFNIGDSGKMDMSKKFFISEEDYALWTRRIEASEGDCVITNVGRIAAVGQIPQGIKAALGRNMTAVRAKPEHMTPSFLIQYLLSPHMQNEVLMKKDSGTIMDSLNVKGIVRLSIVIPLKEVMTLFDNIVKPLRRRLELLAEQNNNLRKTRDLLLPKLINGEIDVEGLDISTSHEVTI